jgi:hypothetical protein
LIVSGHNFGVAIGAALGAADGAEFRAAHAVFAAEGSFGWRNQEERPTFATFDFGQLIYHVDLSWMHFESVFVQW